MPIEKEDVINAMKVLKTMLKAANLTTGDVAQLMIEELEFVDFVPAVKPVEQKAEHILKFNKSFDALYNISMAMADECIGNKTMLARYAKLDEEINELKEQLDVPWLKYGTEQLRNAKGSKHYHTGTEEAIVNVDQIEDEMSDVLFVLLHIAHKFKITPFTLLHKSSSKMLARMNDVNYKAKS